MKLFRQIITCVVAAFIANAGEQITVKANGAANQLAAAELQRLQGTWEGGTVGGQSHQKIIITITGHSLHFHRDANFWFETTITLPAGTDPRQLHATIKDCASGQENSVGEVVVAIYKIEDGKLTLAALGDGGEETPKSFEAAEDKGLTRYELRKVRAREAPPGGPVHPLRGLPPPAAARHLAPFASRTASPPQNSSSPREWHRARRHAEAEPDSRLSGWT